MKNKLKLVGKWSICRPFYSSKKRANSPESVEHLSYLHIGYADGYFPAQKASKIPTNQSWRSHFFRLLLRCCSKIFESGVKRNFWPLRNLWPVIVFQLFCFSEERNKVWQLLFWCMLCKLKHCG